MSQVLALASIGLLAVAALDSIVLAALSVIFFPG